VGAKPGSVKLQNIVCSGFSMMERFLLHAALVMKIAMAESCGLCCDEDRRSEIFSSLKGWHGLGRDIVAAGAVNPCGISP